jgi:hypothetical protein
MFETRRLWIAAVLVAGATIVTAQTQVGGIPGGGFGDVGGKIEPVVNDAGFAVCFGDGTGTNCPANNPGLPGYGCDNFMHTGGAFLDAHGTPKVSKDSMYLSVSNVPPGTTLIYMQGTRLVSPPRAFGYGLMCLGGTVTRLAVKRTIDSTSWFPEFGDPWLSNAGNIPRQGGTVLYQILYRDEHRSARLDHLNTSNAWLTVWVP